MKRRYSATRLTGLLLGAALAVCAPAWGQPQLNVVGTWGGAVNAVFVDESVNPDIAYVAAGRRLVILNVADPTNILELGSIDLGNLVLDVSVQGGFAFVIRGSNPDIHVIDVSDPSNPTIVWTHNGNTARQIRLRGNAAYVRARNDLDVYDISDPANPVYRGRLVSSIVKNNISIADDLLYILWEMWDGTHKRAAVKIADLSGDPFSLVVIGEVNLPWLVDDERPLDIDVDGDYACMTVRTENPAGGRLAVIDVSDPAAPFVAGVHNGGFTIPGDVAFTGGFAYVADYDPSAIPAVFDSALRVFDVATNPSAPALVGVYESHGAIKGVEVAGTRAYVRDEGEGLIILDVTEPPDPVRLGNWHSPAELRRMEKVGDLLYVTDVWNGFTILDLADPSNPTPVGVYQTGPDGLNNFGIDLRGGLAYLAAGFGGIDVVDISDPANPTRVGGFPFNPCILSVGLTLAGDIAHVGTSTCSGSGFLVNFDVSDINNILDVGFVLTDSPPRTIDASLAGYAFVARGDGEGSAAATTVLDTSDPAQPAVIWDQSPPKADDLVRRGNLLYVADGDNGASGGLHILDVSDPGNPVEVGYFPTRSAYGVAVRNQFAYLTGDDPANGFRGTLFILDISDPTNPGLVTKHVVLAGRSVLVDGRTIYVATIAKGLLVLELTGEWTPGDMNCDGALNGADIDPFFLALGDPAGYALAFPNCDPLNGDMNGDGRLDGGDIDPFFECLGGGGCP